MRYKSRLIYGTIPTLKGGDVSYILCKSRLIYGTIPTLKDGDVLYISVSPVLYTGLIYHLLYTKLYIEYEYPR